MITRKKNRSKRKEKRDYLAWAPKEDKVLLDLLVEQVHKGRKQENLFTRDAWDEVVLKFNEVMRTNKTKANMTNRMKTWRKTYRIVSEMIENEFIWDDSRKMITATDAVWDDYIKAHSEAKAYRYRPILSYRKLALVVGNTGDGPTKLEIHDPESKPTSAQSLDGCSLENVMEESSSEKSPYLGCSLNEQTQLIDMLVDQMHEEKEKNTNFTEDVRNEVVPCFDNLSNMLEGLASEKSPDFLWSPSEDKLLINLLAEQVLKDRKKENDFTHEAWDEVTLRFNIMMSTNKTKENLITRMIIWRKMYDVFTAMIEEDGFLWDKSRQMVIAEDAVWDNYVEVHPEAQSFRDKLFANCRSLETVFGHSVTGGLTQATPTAHLYATQARNGFQTADGYATGSSSPNKSTYHLWSAREDKVLLDLFVEQVHKGMRRENMFTKEAWKEVIQKFNEVMKTNKTKDHVVNRMKTWKKTYSVVSALIDQDGFSWDDSLKMVIADDEVWDDYIKAHPEAKSYRDKVIANFDELVIVLGISDSSNSLSLTTRVLNLPARHETEIENTADELEKEPLPRSKKSRATYLPWPPSEDKLLLDLLVGQVHKGEKRDKAFTKDAWNEVVSKFNEVTRSKKTKDHMINRMKTWRRTYSIISAMIDQNGFMWDDSKSMVVADDAVWDNYLKDHPEAKYLRYKCTSNYNQLAMVVGNAVPDGSQTTHVNSLETAGRAVQILSGFELENVVESSASAGEGHKRESMKGSKRQRRSRTPPSSRNRQKAQDSSPSMDGLMDVVNVVASAFSKLYEKKEEKEIEGTVDSWYEALTAVPDLDEDLFLEATILLQDREKGKLFTRLDPKLRRKWLIMMLRRPQP